jgi:hypothetical protein
MAEATRLEFALRNLRPADWEAFERFAGAFLADEFPDLRAVAGVGDKGRDAILQEPADSGVIMQYSIVEDWRAKILRTLDRLEEKEIACSVLIYATNREIGTRSDDLKAELRKRGISLDVRDRLYFVDRVNRSESTRGAVEELAARIVDPLLPANTLVRNEQLGNAELRAGLLYLELQLHDADQQRGLTKLAFDGLVRATLAETNPENMKSRTDIVGALSTLFPSHNEERLTAIVDGSLERLRNRRSVVYRGRDDSYALHHSERSALAERTGVLLEEQRDVDREIVHRINTARETLEITTPVEDSEDLLDAVRATIEAVLDHQGNEFAMAVTQADGQFRRTDVYDIARAVVTPKFESLRVLGLGTDDLAELVSETVVEIVIAPDRILQRYLRELADAYTLLAFLRETPDVQQAVKRLFGEGTLILDTTVVLPVFAETTLSVSEQRFSNLLRAALRVGIKLLITEGVLEEVSTHLDRCVAFSRTETGQWQGAVPFVYRHWSENRPDGADGGFPAFADRFRGRANPLDDLADFLGHKFGIEMVDLNEAADRFPVEVRGRATEIWRERRKERRAYRPEAEIDLLVSHDVEMFFGTLALRSGEERGGICGHQNWWVTIDGTALRMPRMLAEEGYQLPSNPCMSPNFLANLIAIGPGRATLDPSLRERLPVALDIQQFGWGVAELAKIADDLRRDHSGQPEYFIRRKTREAMQRLKTRRDAVDAPLVEDEDILTVTG